RDVPAKEVGTIVQHHVIGASEVHHCPDVLHGAIAHGEVILNVLDRHRHAIGLDADVEETVQDVNGVEVAFEELAPPVDRDERPGWGDHAVDRDVVGPGYVGADLQTAGAIHKGVDGRHHARLQRFDPELHAGRAAPRGGPGLGLE